MNELLKMAHHSEGVDKELMDHLRRALLLSDREESRRKGQRKLKTLSDIGDPLVSPLAMAGLASSYTWSGDLQEAMKQCQSITLLYPYSAVSIWCASLLISIYRSLGMSREVFDAQSDKMRLMKKIILQSDQSSARIYALHELKKELEGWGQREESEHFTRELRDLVANELNKKIDPPLFNEDLT